MSLLKQLKGTDCQDGADHDQCHQIVAEAADLDNNFRLSAADYRFHFHYGYGATSDDQVLKAENLKESKIIDCKTGAPLRSSAKPIAGGDGRVGEVLFVVHPAFIRKSSESSQKIVLVKPTIVVKFDQPVPRGGKGAAAV